MRNKLFSHLIQIIMSLVRARAMKRRRMPSFVVAYDISSLLMERAVLPPCGHQSALIWKKGGFLISAQLICSSYKALGPDSSQKPYQPVPFSPFSIPLILSTVSSPSCWSGRDSMISKILTSRRKVCFHQRRSSIAFNESIPI